MAIIVTVPVGKADDFWDEKVGRRNGGYWYMSRLPAQAKRDQVDVIFFQIGSDLVGLAPVEQILDEPKAEDPIDDPAIIFGEIHEIEPPIVSPFPQGFRGFRYIYHNTKAGKDALIYSYSWRHKIGLHRVG